MYSQTIKVQSDKEIVAVILKKLKIRNLEDYLNSKLKEDISKLIT
jgi:hypothetical protein